MRKYLLFIFICFAVLILLFLFKSPPFRLIKEKTCPLDAKICSDGTTVGRILPDCEFDFCPGEQEGILISSPKRNEKVSSPLKIEGKAKGFWFFEAQFKAILLDGNNDLLGEALLTAKDNWMSEDYVDFEGELVFDFSSEKETSGVLRFLSANPSGEIKNQKIYEMPVIIKGTEGKMSVLLYYYRPEQDKDESGNILCSKKGLVAIERFIPKTQTPIKDTLLLFLKGKENLNSKEIDQGITTEFPLKGLKLVDLNLKEDGTLIVKFDDPFNQTSGGSCRVNILWSQIEATLKQFPQVKNVKFLPEELFQP